MKGFLNTNLKTQCFGCEACVQACPQNIISMKMDDEGFYYPIFDEKLCTSCNACHNVCPIEEDIKKFNEKQIAFGGYIKNSKIRDESTSGGAFSAIVENWCVDNYVIFGATCEGLTVFHDYITDKKDIGRFRKSKYLQSHIGDSYNDVKNFLIKGKKVIFSGTPCQIAALKTFLKHYDTTNLLTIDVVCQGLPTPFFMEKYEKYLEKKYGSNIKSLDYRFTDMKSFKNYGKGRWDFQVISIILNNGKNIKEDRWFSPFWNIWLNHLMSRPSCYECPFTTLERVADITLADLWGVHEYCPELYGNNGGSSLIICNSKKGIDVLKRVEQDFVGHVVDINDARNYQSPLRQPIVYTESREKFMDDLKVLDYEELTKKWFQRHSLKFLIDKYLWGNRRRVQIWNIKNKIKLKLKKITI